MVFLSEDKANEGYIIAYNEPLKPTRNKAGLVCQRFVAGRLSLALDLIIYGNI